MFLRIWALLEGAKTNLKDAYLHVGVQFHWVLALFRFMFVAHQSQFFFLLPPNAEKLGKGIHGSYFMDGMMHFAVNRDQAPDGRRNTGAYPVKYVLTEPGKTKTPSKAAAKEVVDNLEDLVLLHQVR